jgi:hypothetical protein
MERARVIRYLRIAVTALSLTACVLLIALWVRSYFCNDYVQGRVFESRCFAIDSLFGRTVSRTFDALESYEWEWGMRDKWVALEAHSLLRQETFVGFGLIDVGGSRIVVVPHWFLVLVAAAIASFPWMPWRFSLRTLIIATTLVAIGLGVISAAS